MANSKNSSSDDGCWVILGIIALIAFGIYQAIAYVCEVISDFYHNYPVPAILIFISVALIIIFLLRLLYVYLDKKASIALASRKKQELLDNKKAQLINTIETAVRRKQYEFGELLDQNRPISELIKFFCIEENYDNQCSSINLNQSLVKDTKMIRLESQVIEKTSTNRDIREKFETIQKTIREFSEIHSKLLHKNFCITSPNWEPTIKKAINFLQSLRRELHFYKSSLDSKLAESMQAWINHQRERIDIEISRLEALIDESENYPIEYYLKALPEDLDEQDFLRSDQVKLPGNIFNNCLTVYFKLKEELLKIRLVDPEPNISATNLAELKNLLADFFNEKIEYAKQELWLSAEDRDYKIFALKETKERFLKRQNSE